MGHFAKVLNGKVIRVIVAEPEFFQNFIDDSPGEWIQTSYNTKEGVHTGGGQPLRKNYAGPGFTYDKKLDAFIAPKDEKLKSWILDEEKGTWKAPVEKPKNGKKYQWNEETLSWDEISKE